LQSCIDTKTPETIENEDPKPSFDMEPEDAEPTQESKETNKTKPATLSEEDLEKKMEDGEAAEISPEEKKIAAQMRAYNLAGQMPELLAETQKLEELRAKEAAATKLLNQHVRVCVASAHNVLSANFNSDELIPFEERKNIASAAVENAIRLSARVHGPIELCRQMVIARALATTVVQEALDKARAALARPAMDTGDDAAPTPHAATLEGLSEEDRDAVAAMSCMDEAQAAVEHHCLGNYLIRMDERIKIGVDAGMDTMNRAMKWTDLKVTLPTLRQLVRDAAVAAVNKRVQEATNEETFRQILEDARTKGMSDGAYVDHVARFAENTCVKAALEERYPGNDRILFVERVKLAREVAAEAFVANEQLMTPLAIPSTVTHTFAWFKAFCVKSALEYIAAALEAKRGEEHAEHAEFNAEFLSILEDAKAKGAADLPYMKRVEEFAGKLCVEKALRVKYPGDEPIPFEERLRMGKEAAAREVVCQMSKSAVSFTLADFKDFVIKSAFFQVQDSLFAASKKEMTKRNVRFASGIPRATTPPPKVPVADVLDEDDHNGTYWTKAEEQELSKPVYSRLVSSPAEEKEEDTTVAMMVAAVSSPVEKEDPTVAMIAAAVALDKEYGADFAAAVARIRKEDPTANPTNDEVETEVQLEIERELQQRLDAEAATEAAIRLAASAEATAKAEAAAALEEDEEVPETPTGRFPSAPKPPTPPKQAARSNSEAVGGRLPSKQAMVTPPAAARSGSEAVTAKPPPSKARSASAKRTRSDTIDEEEEEEAAAAADKPVGRELEYSGAPASKRSHTKD
jgi:hypothetical protein